MGNPQHASRPPLRRRGERRLGRFIALALLVHAELALVGGLLAYLFAPRDADVKARLAAAAKANESIEIGMVDDETAQRIVADLERAAEKQKAEEIKKEVDSVKAPGQVVDVPAPLEEHRPDDARFASEHDTSVDKEMKKLGKFDPEARQGAAGGEADSSKPDVTGAPTPPAPPSVLAMRTPRAVEGPTGVRGAARPTAPGDENGAPDDSRPDPNGELARLGSRVQPPLGSPGTRGGSVSLMPSQAQLARAIGTGTSDALPDVDEGDETALNSKKWRFATFFNRVKHQVEEHWHPAEVYRRRDPSGAIYGRTNRLTIVRVKLKPDGKLANLELEQPSGLEFLDDEALQAFREASPFPNPPHQLIEAGEGLINFRFGFLFELSGVSRPMLFKYNM